MIPAIAILAELFVLVAVCLKVAAGGIIEDHLGCSGVESAIVVIESHFQIMSSIQEEVHTSIVVMQFQLLRRRKVDFMRQPFLSGSLRIGMLATIDHHPQNRLMNRLLILSLLQLLRKEAIQL